MPRTRPRPIRCLRCRGARFICTNCGYPSIDERVGSKGADAILRGLSGPLPPPEPDDATQEEPPCGV